MPEHDPADGSNPFQAPQDDATLRRSPTTAGDGLIVRDSLLASPFSRFAARFADQVLVFFGMLPGFLLALGFRDLIGNPELAGGIAIALALLGAVGVVGYNWMLISTEGRTIGKRALGIRIVTVDGEPLGFVRGVVLREWVVTVVDAFFSVVMGLGVLGLIDGLMVFTVGNRTLHDRIARTQVVRDTVRIDASGATRNDDDWLDEL